MLDLFNLPTPQGCNIQTFYGNQTSRTWIKPRGVSNVYMMLIGAGGNGTGTTGGGSGAVTVWYGSANNVPDNLIITIRNPVSNTTVGYYNSSGEKFLLTASSGASSGGTAGAAMTSNQFAASGYFQSVAGQNGSTGNPGASTTTFLSGGGAVASGITANYGYFLTGGAARNGIFMTQPIIVGAGGSGAGNGGIGCGGGLSSGIGGPGMVLIASW